MKSVNTPKARLLLTLFALLFGLLAQTVEAETLIYNNSIESGMYHAPERYNEIIDYGTSSGGNVVKFTFGYATSRMDPGTITILFYKWTDYNTCPGTFLQRFNISGLPGSPDGYAYSFIEDFVIPANKQFNLYSNGDFGYSYEFTNDYTGVLLAYGGTGNEDQFWYYDDFYDDWWLTWFGGSPWAGFYMKVYTGPVGPPHDPNTCDIEGYKFDDTNGNAVWDPGEPGLAGWEIYLDNNSNSQYDIGEPSATTDPNGHYEFLDLEPGTYTIAEVLQNGWTQTLPGGDGTYQIIAEPNETYKDKNFGNFIPQPGSINGIKFHDLNGNGIREGGESGLEGWEIYLDLNENGQWDSGEPKNVTGLSGSYEFPNLQPGTYNVAEVPQVGWIQTAPPIQRNILVCYDEYNDERIVEYTQAGEMVWSVDVDLPVSEPIMYQARDIIIDEQNNIYVFNGTFEPYLSKYELDTNQWVHHTIPGWGCIANLSFGGIARFQNYIFLTDHSVAGAEEEGIVRFNTVDLSYVRFATNYLYLSFFDLNIGLDGLLYVLENGGFVYVFNPLTFELLSSFHVTFEARGIAANASGEIFIVSWGGGIYKYDIDGILLDSAGSGFGRLADIDIAADGTIVLSSIDEYDIVLTDESLDSFDLFSIGSWPDIDTAFVTFVNPILSYTVEVGSGQAVTVDFGNRQEVVDITCDVQVDNAWMYQNLPGQANSELTATVSITDDPLSNSGYSYTWEFILPSDVSITPTTVDGGTAADAYWTFAAAGCDEPEGLSDSGQTFKVRVTVTGDDYDNTGTAEAEFGIALLGDVNNNGRVNLADRSIINSFWKTGSVGACSLRDCDVNCNGYVNIADRSIANSIWKGTLGQNAVSEPCPLRSPCP